MQRALGALYGPERTPDSAERAQLSEAEGGQTFSPSSEVPMRAQVSTAQAEPAGSRDALSWCGSSRANGMQKQLGLSAYLG